MNKFLNVMRAVALSMALGSLLQAQASVAAAKEFQIPGPKADPDTSDGMGQKGSLDVYVNGNKVKTVDLNSYWMWQYFASGNPSDAPDGGVGCFAFDEVHFLLDEPLKEGDRIKIQSSGANG